MTRKSLDELFKWRYATKKMDPNKSVPQEKVDAIVEAVRMAPTSSGVQPFELIVITNSDVRAKIQAAAKGQTQIIDGSHLLVFAAWDNYTEARIDDVATLNIEARGESPLIEMHYGMVKSMFLPQTAEANHAHAAKQAYIALGFALIAAADLDVDCTPMEGFDPQAVDQILGLGDRGLKSVALMPLGYRDVEGDWLLQMKKVRKSREALVTVID
ncbi:MAG: NAD(P)H-dependent oxidoreductase [Pseudomonadota bacterium]